MDPVNTIEAKPQSHNTCLSSPPPKARFIVNMQCPQCHREFKLDVYTLPEWQWCGICPYQGPTETFFKKGVE